MQTSTKLYILVAVVVVLACVYGGLYWYACANPWTELAERMLSEEKRAKRLVAQLGEPGHFREEASALVAMADPAVPALLGGLGDEDADIRSGAALVLGWIGDASAVPAVIRCLSDDSKHVRFAAVRSLRALGDSSAVPELEKLLDDGEAFVRGGAREAISAIRAAQGAAPAD